MKVSENLKTLGLFIGPTGAAASWSKPGKGMLTVSKEIKSLGGGLTTCLIHYNSWCISKAGYVAQCYNPTIEMLLWEKWCLQNITCGPWWAIPCELLWVLRRTGGPTQARSLATLCKAAKARVFHKHRDLVESARDTINKGRDCEETLMGDKDRIEWLDQWCESNSMAQAICSAYEEVLPHVHDLPEDPKAVQRTFYNLLEQRMVSNAAAGAALMKRMMHWFDEADARRYSM